MTPLPKIAIIGAGPAGLTLARILQRASIPSTIYELDKTPENRDQGGSLDLHPSTGQAALLAAGLMREFRRFARPEGDCKKVVRGDGVVVWDDNHDVRGGNECKVEMCGDEDEEEGVVEGRPEIDRGRLRDILLDSINPGTIQWGKKLIIITPSSTSNSENGTTTQISEKYDLHFSDSESEKGFDLVIGADGAWSKVRPLLTDIQPFYSGITAIELWALDVNERNPWLSKYVGKGSCFLFDEGRALLCQRNGSIGMKDSVRMLACIRQSESWSETCGIDWEDPDVARERIAKESFAGCGEDVQRAIREAGDEMRLRKLWMLPVGMEWEGKKGLTLMGDAAHLMTPFAGVGVNVAMADAKDLGEKIVAWWNAGGENYEGGDGLDVVVREYEKEMFVRGKANAEMTARGLRGHFSKGGAEDFVERLTGHAASR